MPRQRCRMRPAAPIVATVAVLLLGGCGGEESAPAPESSGEPGLLLDFDDQAAQLVDGAEVLVGGSGRLRAMLRTLPAQGAATRVDGREGGAALRLPAHVPEARTDGVGGQPLAAVSVSPISLVPPHPLDPGAQPFSVGASFRLDETAGRSVVDSGDNLVQRGSFDDPAQYKLQVDGRQPSCRVAGDEGGLLVRSNTEVRADTWYDVLCTRSDSGLELSVTEHAGDGDPTTRTFTAKGPTGDLSGLDPGVPLSVGGKLTTTGLLVRQDTDQFNGIVDDVVLDIEG